ncbi:hypothetical protein DFA_02391 [Cavenderia fasciculata]|uniref:Uncharacterized protein n=1 Tax=Cavenderia fasciculata TaxID=261658 RepID=F4PZB5_CACFS|nr:uncharacterized protein DFA_02391 [Cavenderia fasciculata]EGG19144.1 hypothetical protein DFA_02391 [Cavenderia fasciculata]|eukprot:XP_004366777.1 hypothetical protein DFA_02391 [Cavenderia fasciculata]
MIYHSFREILVNSLVQNLVSTAKNNNLTAVVVFTRNLNIELDFKTKVKVQPIIDLSSLPKLETLKLDGDDSEHHIKYTVNQGPPKCVQFLSQSTLPLLEQLKVNQSILIKGGINLSPLLKKLFIDLCSRLMPVNFIIPSSVSKFTIYKETEKDILGEVVFPRSLTCLSIYQGLPESIVQLKLNIKEPIFPSLPQQLKQFTWRSKPHMEDNPLLVFPAIENYPPLLETLNLSQTHRDFTVAHIPSITKYLSLALLPVPSVPKRVPTYSIGRILENDNSKVLVLEKQSLTGGIITQRKTVDPDQFI